MFRKRRPWQEELAIIDRAMKAISGVMDAEEMVTVYWNHVGELIGVQDYVATSRRDVDPPKYVVTRSSRFTEFINPWTQRDRLPRLEGGLLGEIAYANAPVVMDDLPARLKPDDPGKFYLEGFESLIALPVYDRGEGINVTALLFQEGDRIDPAMVPMIHWQSGLFGRGTHNLVLRNQLTEALGALDRELQTVGEIQRSLLPARLPSIDGFDIATMYQTSARAGGDYYDFFPLGGGAWGLFIADVSGHGTPAAVLMAITHAIAHAQPGTHTPPAALLDYLNDTLTRSYTQNGTFVTAFYAVLDPKSQVLRLTDVALDVESEGVLGAAVRATAPYLESAVAERTVIDLKPFAANARKSIQAAIAEFRGAGDGVRVDASVADLRVVGIAFDATTLRIIAEADGAAKVSVTSLPK